MNELTEEISYDYHKVVVECIGLLNESKKYKIHTVMDLVSALIKLIEIASQYRIQINKYLSHCYTRDQFFYISAYNESYPWDLIDDEIRLGFSTLQVIHYSIKNSQVTLIEV